MLDRAAESDAARESPAEKKAKPGFFHVYAQYLMDVMRGLTPRDHHLPDMYQALLELAGHVGGLEEEFRVAEDAVEEGDVEAFKWIREKIVQKAVACLAKGNMDLFDDDDDKKVDGVGDV